jgi:para-nitrobenzyl esterase
MIANTEQGKVRGIEKMGCVQFRGIPYAAPPVGKLRWQGPQSPGSWDGERDATEFGAICPQVTGGMEQITGGRAEANPMDEDCLTLNVFTPSLEAMSPVMVWIHGGAFSTGSGRLPWYYGHNFARDGVVCVTINYRVNAFGFLDLEDAFGSDYRDTGNLGIRDQIAALEWVRDNIANFGGDPNDVTVFGESAGGGSVGSLMGSPKAKGLFTKAIPQSGAGHWAHTPDVAARITRRFLDIIGVKPGDVDALLATPTERIIEGVEALSATPVSQALEVFGPDHDGATMAFQPLAGGDILPVRAIDAIFDGAAAGIATLVGTTREEWKLFTLMASTEDPGPRAVRPLRNLCEKRGRSADDLVSAYERKPGVASELDLRNAIETDRMFWIPAVRMAEAQAKNGTPVWAYRFDWPSPAFGGRFGACHALEIPFVFDNLDAPGADVFTGGAAPQNLAARMHAAWVAFAKTGNPKTDELPDWPSYESSKRATMLLDEECKLAEDPDAELRALWDGLL